MVISRKITIGGFAPSNLPTVCQSMEKTNRVCIMRISLKEMVMALNRGKKMDEDGIISKTGKDCDRSGMSSKTGDVAKTCPFYKDNIKTNIFVYVVSGNNLFMGSTWLESCVLPFNHG